MNFSVSKRGEYGLIACVYLAQHAVGQRRQIHEIAERCGLPEPFLAQILRRLVREGLIDSKKGVGGGFTLSRKASEISFLNVLEALDGPVVVNTCQGPNACDHTGDCALEPVWARAQEALINVLRMSMLTEAMGNTVYPLSGMAGARKG